MNGHNGARAGECHDRLPTRIAQTIGHDAHTVSYNEVALPKNGSKVWEAVDHWGAKFLQGRERLLLSWRRSRPVSLPLTPAVDIAEAEEFVRGFYAENPRHRGPPGAPDPGTRLGEPDGHLRAHVP